MTNGEREDIRRAAQVVRGRARSTLKEAAVHNYQRLHDAYLDLADRLDAIIKEKP